ncbi:MAG: AmmeMemoRadiSam system protein B [bacterium]
MIKKAKYAGSWYPASAEEVRMYLDAQSRQTTAIGAVCPHAGWIYSGKTAGRVFSKLAPADVYILIGPNHRGEGSDAAVFAEDYWDLPLGKLYIDETFSAKLIENSHLLVDDPHAHAREHSLEVVCPFIQTVNPSAHIVPILIKNYDNHMCEKIGKAIAQSINTEKGKTYLIIASSDMTHFEPASIALQQDRLALAPMLALQPEALLKIVDEKGISMCGSGPVAAMLYAAIQLGAKRAELIDYTNSGMVTGDSEDVVAYAGLIVL